MPVAIPKPPATSSKPQTPAEAHRDADKKEVTSVYFTNEKGVRIKEADYNTTIRVNITSKNLVGFKFILTVKDEDRFKDDILIDAKEYTFTSDMFMCPFHSRQKCKEPVAALAIRTCL